MCLPNIAVINVEDEDQLSALKELKKEQDKRKTK